MRTDPRTGCEICRGTGKSYVEHPDGTLTEIECRYCHGRKDSTWVAEKAATREHAKSVLKVGILVYLGLLWITNGINWWSVGGSGPPGAFVLHCVAWFVGIAGLWWWAINRKVRTKAPKHAPGFTEPREQIMGGAFAGAVLLKAKWDQSHKHPGV